MSTPHSPSGESEATRRFEAELDRVERSPAQPTGPDRIDDDNAASATETSPPNMKHDHSGRMEH
jgi:hypothetical protein